MRTPNSSAPVTPQPAVEHPTVARATDMALFDKRSIEQFEPGPDHLTEFADVQILLRKWRAAKSPDAHLPLYEDLVLGGLGKLASESAIVRCLDGQDPVLVRAGDDLENIVQTKCDSTPLAKLPIDYRLSIDVILKSARQVQQPCLRLCLSTVDGMISTVELIALPLASRWQGEFFLLFARPRAHQIELARLLINSTRDGIMALSVLEQRNGEPLDFVILSINDGAAHLLGSTAEELRSARLSETLSRAGFQKGMKALRAALRKGDHCSFTFEYEIDGHLASLKAGISKAGDLLTVTLTDVGELKARETLFRSMFDDNPVPMVVRSCEDQQVLRVNDAALRLYGYQREEFLNLKLRDLRICETQPQKGDQLGATYAGGRCWRHQAACGTSLNVVEYEREITDEGVPAILATIVDMTERARAEAQISFMAHHDPLTGLSNRTVFTHALEDATASVRNGGAGFAVVTVDLDGFKLINDTLGHDAGDEVLTGVAERLRDLTGEAETVARLGGDEFALILPAVVSRQDLADRALRIISVLNRPHRIDGREVKIAASVGISVVPDDTHIPEQVLKFADLALYRAKKDSGSAYRFFEPEMDRVESERRQMAVELRRAVIENEFALHYQPIMSVKTGQLRGFEALIRWSHPTRGAVSPAEFIPVAEEIGLIEQLGAWVMEEACREAAGWPNSLIVAVNVSAQQFGGGKLVSRVERAIAESGLDANRLEIEITESVLLNETDDNIEILRQLRGLGVRIALDDFGTGYSSMGYLTKFPFSRIKIDRSFVRDIRNNVGSRAIVRAIIGLGSSLGMDITAEGVETTEQLDVLRDENCGELQGYLFSPPIPRQNLGPIIDSYCGDQRQTGPVPEEGVA